jgi:hypothetical protein
MPDIDMQPVTGSKNVVARGYDSVSKTMRITFVDRHGTQSTYEYPDVSLDLWADFLAAPSAGSFVAQHIRGRQCVKL